MADKIDIIKEKQEIVKRDQSCWRDVYERAREDAHFLSDDEFAQWDEDDYNSRVMTGRPALTIDQLGQFIHQVANDIRINTPTINVIPAGHDSDVETAEVFKGLIKSIEYASGADDAYDTASLNSIRTSLGFIRVDHDYIDGDTFDQELLIKRVVNPLACWLDADSIELDGRDAKHATIIDKITVKEFKRQYPDKDPVCFQSDDKSNREPKDEDYISIAEHFCIEEEEKTIELEGRKRKTKTKTVRRYKMSGADILEETTFPSKYIPLVPVYGEEIWIDGKRHIMSLIRKSKSAQKMFNYWKSLETELLMKAPNAPVMAAEGQVEDYADDWKNPSKSMVLRYKTKDVDGNPVGAPQRLEPPTIPTGIVNAARQTVDDIKATMGIYNASLGQRSNEQSGVAIAQRKQEGDVATYHFSDNLVKSICQVGRILVDAIPNVYDTARILRIIGMEGEAKEVGVNGEIADKQEETIDLKKGRYDVRVVTGASFTTQRQEAVAALQSIFQTTPDLMQVMGDLYFKNSDFAGADAMAERMKKVIDPKFLEEEDRQEIQAVDPEKEQMKMIIQQGAQELESLQTQATQKETVSQMEKAQANLKSQYDALKSQEQIATLKIQSLEKDLTITKLQYEAQIKAQQDAAQDALEEELVTGFVGEQQQQNQFVE